MSFGATIEPEPTGNLIVQMAAGASTRDMVGAIHNATGAQVAVSSDFASDETLAGAVSSGEVVVFETIGTAVVRPNDGVGQLAAILTAEPAIERARPEFYFYPINWRSQRVDWMRTGLRLLIDMDDEATAVAATNGLPLKATTWGVEAVGASQSPWTGAGVRVAVLDTGLDLGHPDFLGRNVQAFDFSGGNSADDRQGHGTHVAGTICGPAKPSGGVPRYGVAPDAELYVYKVLNDQGRGEEGRIQAGMEAAIRAGCQVINMSLGRPAGPNAAPDPVYEAIGEAALDAGCLVIAAAGNDSARDLGYIAPVSYPANALSIMAVGAVDSHDKVATFSCGGLIAGGGEIDIAAPGVDVFSATTREKGSYRSLPGTSMACPHVTGVAALLAQSDPALRGRALWRALVDPARARKLASPARDIGVGRVHV